MSIQGAPASPSGHSAEPEPVPVSAQGASVLSAWRCGHPRTIENTQKVGAAGVRCRQCRRAIALKSWRKYHSRSAQQVQA